MKHNNSNFEKNIWLGKQAEKIYTSLLAEIRTGQLRSGTRLPTEMELCKRFRVCRNTVRRALSRLVAEQWLLYRPGVGCAVANVSGLPVATVQMKRSNTVSFMYHGTQGIIVWFQNLLLGHGCLLSLFSQQEQGWKPDLEALFLRQVLEQRHRSLLASCTPLEPTNAPLLAKLAAAGVRVIHVEPYTNDTLPAEPFLMPDYRRAGYAAAAALLLRGYNPILYVGNEKCFAPFHVLQERGLLEAQRELLGNSGKRCLFRGTVPEKSTFVGQQWLFQSPGRKLLRALRGKRPGFFCSTQTLAMRIIDLLRHAGVAVPDEAGVVGPDLPGDQIPPEMLAQVQFPRQWILERAVKQAVADDYCGIRELVPPSRISGGTLTSLDSKKQRKVCDQHNEQS